MDRGGQWAGVLLGLVIGAFLESVGAAILLAMAGAYIAPRLIAAQSKASTLPVASAAPEAPNAVAWKARVDQLEQRVAALEALVMPNMAEAAPPTPEQPTAASSPIPDAANTPLAESEVTTATVAAELPVSAAALVRDPLPAAAVSVEADAPLATQATPASPPIKAVAPAPSKPRVPLRDRLPAPLANLLFGGNMLVKMGVLILFLGLAFLLRYTAERVTVPIELRYTGVALAGAALLALGWFLRRKRADYALVLQGAGIGVFYLTILAAMKLHMLLAPTIGFALLFAVVVLSAALSVLQKSPVLAVVAALEGFAAPVLASTGENRPLGLFTYLWVLDIGIFLVAWFQAWRVLNVIGAVGTFTLAGAWAQQHYTDDQFGLVQPFLVAFFLLFTAISLLFARRTLQDAMDAPDQTLSQRASAAVRRVGRVDSALVFGVPMVAFGMQYLLVRPWDMGAAYSALAFAMFYLLLAKWVFATQPRGLALLAEAYAIVGAIFATLAIPLALEGRWTGAAWAIEAAGMYWLGVRQERPYARAFAFAVMGGAGFKLLHATGLDGAPGQPLLHGSVIGPVLVCAGAFAMWALHRRGKLDVGSGWESLCGAALPWLAMAALTLLPWQLLVPMWAAVATAGMASVLFALAVNRSVLPLSFVSYGMQTLAVAGFIATVHSGTGDAPLVSGKFAALAACLIALSVLASVGYSMLRIQRQALAQAQTPNWSLGNQIGALTGVGMLHLAMLFEISLEQAALLWPLTASVVLWVALRLAHPALALQAGALHAVAGALYILNRVFDGGNNAIHVPFAHLDFWTPVVLGLAALLCGDGLNRHASRLPWCSSPQVRWLPVLWGLVWWLQAVLSESARVLDRYNHFDYVPAVWVGVVLVTSVVATLVALRRDWSTLGRATLATVVGLALLAWMGAEDHSSFYSPFSSGGWLAWPLAVIWHLTLLKIQKKWFADAWLSRFHIAGFWLFLWLAAHQSEWLLAGVGGELAGAGALSTEASAWPLLGWVLVPALSLLALQTQWVLERWPLQQYRHAYLNAAALPVALYLLAWAWITNVTSAGNAALITYVPLFNPLELAHVLVLGAVFLWWRSLEAGTLGALPAPVGKAVAALSALVLLTGAVLRSCHHFADVPWNADALFASRLTQAALSITWALCGVLSMVLGHSKAQRAVWVAGAALLGVVVLKLFFVELADQGGLFRIVSFLSVGVLLLLVGYFAPVPPSLEDSPAQDPLPN